MERADASPGSTSRYLARLLAENQMLREEIRVSREAADITVKLVVEQFEKTEAIMRRLELAGEHLNEKNAELESANARLQQLDKLKSDFLSSVSHELRTPLTSIRGFASLIDREFGRSFAAAADADPALRKKAGRIQENLAIILKESERLTRLINDVLDLAKIESGRTEWRDTLLPIDAFVRDAANAAQGMFAGKPAVALRLDIADNLPAFFGDQDRMQQVLVNLLNNAVKFTDAGSVTVKAWLTPERRIRIDVVDSGIGFPPEEAESIFDKFQQAKQGDTLADRPKGTGLGLAICREIVGRHGGRIWATSQPGAGSTFSLELPPAPDDAAAAPEAAGRATEDAA
ncbi:MAG TPA: HAMP domain-containing sensor histidine kinase, partial [Rhodocyclaceae bacterium]